MLLAKGIAMLEITAAIMGKSTTIYPTLIWDNDRQILIDTAHPGQLPLIQKAAALEGVLLKQITDVVLTHQDIDHIGSLPAVIEQADYAPRVWSSDIEKPYIEGRKRLIKITDEALANLDLMFPPETPAAFRAAFRKMLEHPPHANVTAQLLGGGKLDVCGGISIINTPGHTPGHISLYHHASQTLIAGDALIAENGKLAPPAPAATLDYERALQSLKALADYPIQHVICYHGGLCSGQLNEQIAQISDGAAV
ncbi:hydrolase [Paenibacillus sp. BIHB 4019]|uniref:Hydrolase n=1 Tax=Paenibacillus sp. BIHB 4019 TaxID=1870819 RepID=A0A1B2DDN8_9BACL|nr:MBL fold metallo-hydrolase [Paenibacillus sp. BIHB 4019]ANY65831.1 hydrolase [Paenibacillus sp. BIHB 4019]